MLRATAARLARQASAKQKGAAAKAKTKGGYKGPPGQEVEMSSPMQKQLAELLRPMPRPPPRTEEERARLRPLMIRYGKFRRKMFLIREMKAHKLGRAKAAAFDALPNARRIEVFHATADPFPINRPVFTHTPPIPGFNAGDLTKN